MRNPKKSPRFLNQVPKIGFGIPSTGLHEASHVEGLGGVGFCLVDVQCALACAVLTLHKCCPNCHSLYVSVECVPPTSTLLKSKAR